MNDNIDDKTTGNDEQHTCSSSSLVFSLTIRYYGIATNFETKHNGCSNMPKVKKEKGPSEYGKQGNVL